MFVKTKQLLATALPCTAESNLLGCLKSKACQPQIELYWRLVDKRQEREQMTENNKTVMVKYLYTVYHVKTMLFFILSSVFCFC